MFRLLLLHRLLLLVVRLDGLDAGAVGGVGQAEDEEDCDEPARRDGVEEDAEDGAEEEHGLEHHAGVVVHQRPVGVGVSPLHVVVVVGDGAAEDGGLGQGDAVVRRELADGEVHGHQDAASSDSRGGCEHDGDESDDADENVRVVERVEQRLVLAHGRPRHARVLALVLRVGHLTLRVLRADGATPFPAHQARLAAPGTRTWLPQRGGEQRAAGAMPEAREGIVLMPWGGQVLLILHVRDFLPEDGWQPQVRPQAPVHQS
mmetsp:Transcript_13417/g.30906  ORF Transcript_13417/g.30906 Transcript_13417/m.30906 type:complete len:260 (-) Transcript_13417:133-912(-)